MRVNVAVDAPGANTVRSDAPPGGSPGANGAALEFLFAQNGVALYYNTL